jgi:hypothetical protein
MALYKLDIDTQKANHGFVNIQKAIGIASKNTLNTIGFLVRKNAIKNINDNFTIRSNFTQRNIQVEKTDYIKPSRQVVRVGATQKASYMELQETGGIKQGKNGILTMAQDGARDGSNKRRVNKSYYMRKVKRNIINWDNGKGTRRSRLVAAAYMAKKLNKFLSYKSNMYQITSFQSINGRANFKKRHLYNFSQKSANIKSRAWLEPATRKPIADAQNIFNWQIGKLLKQEII